MTCNDYRARPRLTHPTVTPRDQRHIVRVLSRYSLRRLGGCPKAGR
jgi:hypothetical protein